MSSPVDEEQPPWRNAAGLLDQIEKALWDLDSRCADAVAAIGDDALIYAGPVCGDMEVLGCIILPELRAVLAEADLDVPFRGAWRKLADEWHASRESKEPLPHEPEPEPEGVSYLQRVLGEQNGFPPGTGMSVPATAVAPEASDTTEPRETPLYRWYDEDDLLLYVGITSNLGSRTRGHAMGSSWMDFAVRSTVERHPSKPDALAAEKAAVKAEQPLFNDVHNRTPEARQRLVDYLVRRGRTDLLAPAVSRG